MGSDSQNCYLSDGVYIYLRDPGTEIKKKNRKRHVKDGCPKSERGRRKFKDGVKIETIPELTEIDYTTFSHLTGADVAFTGTSAGEEET